ncbi:hypothetical protein Sjap_002654 [Stephania japonica]|uniref:Uncharacterized protein n=1 Tax=Stephania japonica TaxID=461633 RepID=A0AAP0KPL1_9MAGN
MYLNEQELDQWIQEKNQEAEEEIKLILQKRSANTISVIPLNSVEVKDEEYMSNYEESEGELEVSQSEPEIVMAQTYEEEAEKEIEVTLTRPEDLHQESKDDQSFVLVNPPTLPYIFDDFDMEVDVKERSRTFCTADTFVLDDPEIIDSYVLKVPDKLPFLNKGVSVSLPNAKGESTPRSPQFVPEDFIKFGKIWALGAAGRRKGFTLGNISTAWGRDRRRGQRHGDVSSPQRLHGMGQIDSDLGWGAIHQSDVHGVTRALSYCPEHCGLRYEELLLTATLAASLPAPYSLGFLELRLASPCSEPIPTS